MSAGSTTSGVGVGTGTEGAVAIGLISQNQRCIMENNQQSQNGGGCWQINQMKATPTIRKNHLPKELQAFDMALRRTSTTASSAGVRRKIRENSTTTTTTGKPTATADTNDDDDDINNNSKQQLQMSEFLHGSWHGPTARRQQRAAAAAAQAQARTSNNRGRSSTPTKRRLLRNSNRSNNNVSSSTITTTTDSSSDNIMRLLESDHQNSNGSLTSLSPEDLNNNNSLIINHHPHTTTTTPSPNDDYYEVDHYHDQGSSSKLVQRRSRTRSKDRMPSSSSSSKDLDITSNNESSLSSSLHSINNKRRSRSRTRRHHRTRSNDHRIIHNSNTVETETKELGSTKDDMKQQQQDADLKIGNINTMDSSLQSLSTSKKNKEPVLEVPPSAPAAAPAAPIINQRSTTIMRRHIKNSRSADNLDQMKQSLSSESLSSESSLLSESSSILLSPSLSSSLKMIRRTKSMERILGVVQRENEEADDAEDEADTIITTAATTSKQRINTTTTTGITNESSPQPTTRKLASATASPLTTIKMDDDLLQRRARSKERAKQRVMRRSLDRNNLPDYDDTSLLIRKKEENDDDGAKVNGSENDFNNKANTSSSSRPSSRERRKQLSTRNLVAGGGDTETTEKEEGGKASEKERRTKSSRSRSSSRERRKQLSTRNLVAGGGDTETTEKEEGAKASEKERITKSSRSRSSSRGRRKQLSTRNLVTTEEEGKPSEMDGKATTSSQSRSSSNGRRKPLSTRNLAAGGTETPEEEEEGRGKPSEKDGRATSSQRRSSSRGRRKPLSMRNLVASKEEEQGQGQGMPSETDGKATSSQSRSSSRGRGTQLSMRNLVVTGGDTEIADKKEGKSSIETMKESARSSSAERSRNDGKVRPRSMRRLKSADDLGGLVQTKTTNDKMAININNHQPRSTRHPKQSNEFEGAGVVESESRIKDFTEPSLNLQLTVDGDPLGDGEIRVYDIGKEGKSDNKDSEKTSTLKRRTRSRDRAIKRLIKTDSVERNELGKVGDNLCLKEGDDGRNKGSKKYSSRRCRSTSTGRRRSTRNLIPSDEPSGETHSTEKKHGRDLWASTSTLGSCESFLLDVEDEQLGDKKQQSFLQLNVGVTGKTSEDLRADSLTGRKTRLKMLASKVLKTSSRLLTSSEDGTPVFSQPSEGQINPESEDTNKPREESLSEMVARTQKRTTQKEGADVRTPTKLTPLRKEAATAADSSKGKRSGGGGLAKIQNMLNSSIFNSSMWNFDKDDCANLGDQNDSHDIMAEGESCQNGGSQSRLTIRDTMINQKQICQKHGIGKAESDLCEEGDDVVGNPVVVDKNPKPPRSSRWKVLRKTHEVVRSVKTRHGSNHTLMGVDNESIVEKDNEHAPPVSTYIKEETTCNESSTGSIEEAAITVGRMELVSPITVASRGEAPKFRRNLSQRRLKMTNL